MIGLPRALEPWRGPLALLDPELRLGLGGLMARLALALGPLAPSDSPGDGEPDGYDGLDRRGPYERLLVSEWLLAQELPEEFVRRAAMGEHTFARLARRRPSGARRSVGLFDAGPDQLGSPRVAQLAALLALATRAERAGARWEWGVIQEGRLLAELSVSSVRRLLEGRSAREATEADLLPWRASAEAGGREEEWWLIGGRRLSQLTLLPGASRLVIEDLLEPADRRVAVTVRRPARPASRLELELPASPACVRLLRDPFDVRAAAPTRASAARPASNLLFGSHGQHVLVRLEDGSLLAQPIPNSPAALPGRPFITRLLPGERLLAAGLVHRRGTILVSRDGVAQVQETGRRGGRSGPPANLTPHPDRPFGVLPDAGRALLPLLRIRTGSGPSRSAERFFLASDGRLFTLAGASLVLPLAERVVAVAPFYGHLAWLSEADPAGKVGRRLELHDGLTERVLPVDLEGDVPLEAFFGFGGHLNAPELRGIAAVRLDRQRWRVISGGPRADGVLEVAEGQVVVGVSRDALVALAADRRSLQLVRARSNTSLPPAADPIVQAVCSHEDARVAWLTSAGELVVWSIDLEAALVRTQIGGGT